MLFQSLIFVCDLVKQYSTWECGWVDRVQSPQRGSHQRPKKKKVKRFHHCTGEIRRSDGFRQGSQLKQTLARKTLEFTTLAPPISIFVSVFYLAPAHLFLCSEYSARERGVLPIMVPPVPSRPPSTGSVEASSSRSPRKGRTVTPSTSASSSRRSSLANIDGAAYRYSLNVGSVPRFPTALTGDSTEGANAILAATTNRADVGALDPSRASVSSSTSSKHSRVPRYTVEESSAPQRRPQYLALPSDPDVNGVWSSSSNSNSNSNSNVVGNERRNKEQGGKGKNKRRDSKVMTTFPFPHPTTPRRRPPAEGASGAKARARGRIAGLNQAWQTLLTAIFAGPYERQLNREEREDDRITESIVHNIEQNAASGYGTFHRTNTMSSDPNNANQEPDPYGYRALAGPQLLPNYTTDLVARRRERRRARSRARFQCMALWTIWTVSIVLVIIVGVLVFSFVWPERLDIPHGGGEEGDEDLMTLVMHLVLR